MKCKRSFKKGPKRQIDVHLRQVPSDVNARRQSIQRSSWFNRFTTNMGSVAYSTREYDSDNPVTELVRHTIEDLEVSPLGRLLFKTPEVVDAVSAVRSATPRYAKGDRCRVIEANRKAPVRHRYYSGYLELQRLCLAILTHRWVSLREDSGKVHGILFDGAWLWEEYVNTLVSTPSEKRFFHPRNRAGEGAQHLFNGKNGLIYPDFISLGDSPRIIADAKYKPSKNVHGKDYLQMLAYMRSAVDPRFLSEMTGRPWTKVDVEGLALLRVAGLLADGGTAVVLTTTAATYALAQTGLRQYLVENGLVEACVEVPRRLPSSRQTGLTMWVLSRGGGGDKGVLLVVLDGDGLERERPGFYAPGSSIKESARWLGGLVSSRREVPFMRPGECQANFPYQLSEAVGLVPLLGARCLAPKLRNRCEHGEPRAVGGGQLSWGHTERPAEPFDSLPHRGEPQPLADGRTAHGTPLVGHDDLPDGGMFRHPHAGARCVAVTDDVREGLAHDRDDAGGYGCGYLVIHLVAHIDVLYPACRRESLELGRKVNRIVMAVQHLSYTKFIIGVNPYQNGDNFSILVVCKK